MTNRTKIAAMLAILFLTSSCSQLFQPPWEMFDDDGDDAQPQRVTEPTKKFSLALGGVRPGRDELVIYDALGNAKDFSLTGLSCAPDDGTIATVEARPGYTTSTEGSGVKIVPHAVGITAIRCVSGDNVSEGIYEITIPPQSLIQILLAEAGNQIREEADVDDSLGENVVALTSDSPTANAIARVVRNRIELINETGDTSLFAADETAYRKAPIGSYYDAVIMASDQFAPTSDGDVSHDIFVNAAVRDNLDDDWMVAYDQAVISAAGTFNGDIVDETGGAFAFRSPTTEEWTSISGALTAGAEIPADAGFTDDTFPGLSPIQILIPLNVWKYEDGRPSFIFARRRYDGDPAITESL